MKKFLPLIILTSLVVILFAFRKEEVNITVSGKVFHKEKGLESVRVVVLKSDSIDISHVDDFRKVYNEPTSEDGSFRLQFNILEGAPAFLYFVKQGYSTYKESVFSSGKVKDLPPVETRLIDLSKEGNPIAQVLNVYNKSGQAVKISNQNTSSHSYLHVFKRPDFESSYETFNSNSFRLFTKIKPGKKDVFHIEKREIGKSKKITGTWFEVSFSLKNGSKLSGWIFQ